MTKQPHTPKLPEAKDATAPSMTEAHLQKAQELRRLIGDQRVRVEVPTGERSSKHPIYPVGKRYSVG